jgi:protein-disulfide isomerase
MQTPSSDPRAPFVIGIVVIGALLLAGIIWAVVASPSGPSGTTSDPNLSFRDENDPTLGPSDAKVTLRIFGDIQCPACKSAEPGVAHVREAYANQVRIVWNDFPLPPSVHPLAHVAAQAARCAEEQGRFWEMHDTMYDHQSDWTALSNPENMFIQLAKSIGLDEDGFRTCYEAQRYESKIADDQQEGAANNVDATPTFFVNNTRYVGVISPAQWDAILKPLLPTAAPAMSTSSTK